MATARMPAARPACKRHAGGGLVERLDLLAIDRDAAADLGDALVQQVGQADVEVEQPRAGLVADAQQVGKAAVDQQQDALALAFQQGVGGDRGAHLHRLDRAGRDRGAGGHAEDLADAGDGGVAVALGVLGQQLGGGQPPRGVARDDIGEGAAAIDPELPGTAHRTPPPLASSQCRAAGARPGPDRG